MSTEAVIDESVPQPESSPPPPNYSVSYQMVSPQTVTPHLVPAQTIPGRTVYYHGYVTVTNYVPSYLVMTIALKNKCIE